MKKYFLLLAGVFSLGITSAQVGINTNTPNASAALDVESSTQGFLMPRMNSNQKSQIDKPAPSLLVYDTDLHEIQQNIGTETNPVWVPLVGKSNKNKFFYMPSISIDASKKVTNQTVDLYKKYKSQFTGKDTDTSQALPTFAKSTGAPAEIPYFPKAGDLYYYITYFDNAIVKVNSISADGVLNYDILEEADFDSFMNVVFVIK